MAETRRENEEGEGGRLGPATFRYGHILLRKEVGTAPMEMKGGLWETYVPESEQDTRVFERDIRTGRVVQTRS